VLLPKQETHVRVAVATRDALLSIARTLRFLTPDGPVPAVVDSPDRKFAAVTPANPNQRPLAMPPATAWPWVGLTNLAMRWTTMRSADTQAMRHFPLTIRAAVNPWRMHS
jgi:hypothetical protein